MLFFKAYTDSLLFALALIWDKVVSLTSQQSDVAFAFFEAVKDSQRPPSHSEPTGDRTGKGSTPILPGDQLVDDNPDDAESDSEEEIILPFDTEARISVTGSRSGVSIAARDKRLQGKP